MITIVIPLYNKEKMISKSIESVISQTVDFWELIVVDDGSTDGSRDVVEKYLGDTRIKIIEKHNGGVSSARNEGLRHATGEWVMFLDADDYLMPNAIEIYESAILCPEIQVVLANFYMSFKDSRKLYSTRKRTGQIDNYLIDWIKGDICPSRCGAVLFNREILKGHEFDERISRSEDVKFVVEVLHGLRLQYVSEPVMSYDQDDLFLSRNYVYKKDFASIIKLSDYSFWEKIFLSSIVHQGIKNYPQKERDILKRNLFFRFYYLLNKCVYYSSRIYVKLFN